MRISDWSSDVCSSDLGELPQDALVDGSGFMRQGFKSWTTHRDRTVCIRKLVGFGPGLAARILASFNMAADTPFLRPDTHTPRPAEGHEPIGPGRRENPLISADVVNSSGLQVGRAHGCWALGKG